MEYKSIKSALVVFLQPLAKCKQKFVSQKKTHAINVNSVCLINISKLIKGEVIIYVLLLVALLQHVNKEHSI